VKNITHGLRGAPIEKFLELEFKTNVNLWAGYELNSSLQERASETLANYMVETQHAHGIYALIYLGCELLSIINVAGQLFVINRYFALVIFYIIWIPINSSRVFEGGFLKFGPEILKWLFMDPEYRSDPLIKIFPR